MKTTAIYLTPFALTGLLAASPLAAEELELRYRAPAGTLAMEVGQDIYVGGDEKPLADRAFLIEFELESDAGAVAVRLAEAKGTYTAHDMTQRLPTRHLKNQSFEFTVANEGRALRQAEGAAGLVVDIGWVTPEGYPLPLVLADLLPVLPEEAVGEGYEWSAGREVNALVGWGWVRGQLNSRHTVTGIENGGGSTLVAVQTRAEAELEATLEGGPFSLSRELEWQFDATNGRLVSLSMTEQAEAVSKLPQGNIPVRQVTRVQLSP